MTAPSLPSSIRDILIGACVAGLVAVASAYAGLPSRVTSLESAFQSMDKKLDILIQRTR